MGLGTRAARKLAMTRLQARIRARQWWGPTADAWTVRRPSVGTGVYRVGIVLTWAAMAHGAGDSWEQAFERAKKYHPPLMGDHRWV